MFNEGVDLLSKVLILVLFRLAIELGEVQGDKGLRDVD